MDLALKRHDGRFKPLSSAFDLNSIKYAASLTKSIAFKLPTDSFAQT